VAHVIAYSAVDRRGPGDETGAQFPEAGAAPRPRNCSMSGWLSLSTAEWQ